MNNIKKQVSNNVQYRISTQVRAKVQESVWFHFRNHVQNQLKELYEQDH